MPGFCMSQIRPHVRVRSPSILPKNNANSTKIDNQKADDSGKVVEEVKPGGSEKLGEVATGRRIMVVVDSSIEAKGALQWALTQTVQSHDSLILLYVNKLSKQGDGDCSRKVIAPRVSEFLQSMKSYCKMKRPEVRVEVAVAEGKERGPAIVKEAKKQGVAMLVLGQKKQSMTWRLLVTWAGNRVAGSGGVVEYCIQNANCIAIGVRRKSRKLGGYLITTKRHKDFWLLA